MLRETSLSLADVHETGYLCTTKARTVDQAGEFFKTIGDNVRYSDVMCDFSGENGISLFKKLLHGRCGLNLPL
jgi:hypothetical protein